MNSPKKSVVRRSTTQRALVLAAVSQGNHLSAREIFEQMCQTTHMSCGTVYRNLQILEEEGEIIAVQADPDVLRYDRKRIRHYHLRCKKCGRVFDIPMPYCKDLDMQAEEKSGFAIESHTLSFEGLCLDCRMTAE